MKLSSKDRKTMTTKRQKPAVLSPSCSKRQVAATAPSAIQPPIHKSARYLKLPLSCEETIARTERLPWRNCTKHLHPVKRQNSQRLRPIQRLISSPRAILLFV